MIALPLSRSTNYAWAKASLLLFLLMSRIWHSNSKGTILNFFWAEIQTNRLTNDEMQNNFLCHLCVLIFLFSFIFMFLLNLFYSWQILIITFQFFIHFTILQNIYFSFIYNFSIYFSSMALKLIIIRLIRRGSKPYWKIASYYRQFSTKII